MNYEKFEIKKNYTQVYYFLKDKGLSESFITSLRKKNGSILINDKKATTRSPINENDILKIDLDAKERSNFLTINEPLYIAYEDEYLLIVNKPPLYCSTPSKSHYKNNLAAAILGYMKNKSSEFVLRMKNRLDKDTAGLIIVAKDIISYNNITNIDKTYHAICMGNIYESIQIDKPIKTMNTNGINELKRIISEDGKPAKTYVEPLQQLKNSSLIELKLENGRTHQIRVHLSSLGHPLIGDEVYGQKSNLISHTALVCKKVSFNHPRTKKRITLEIDYPEDFLDLLNNLTPTI